MKRFLLAASMLAALSGAAQAQSAFSLTGGGVPGHVLLNNMGLSKVDTLNGVSTNQTLHTPNLVGTTNAGPINSSGAIQGASLGTTGAVSGGTVAASGAVTGASVTATGGVTGASVTATGPVIGGSISASGSVSGASVGASGIVSGAQLSVSTVLVSALPASCVAGTIMNTSDGRKSGEGAGAGSGVPVVCEVTTFGGSTTAWYSFFSGAVVTN